MWENPYPEKAHHVVGKRAGRKTKSQYHGGKTTDNAANSSKLPRREEKLQPNPAVNPHLSYTMVFTC